VRDHYADFRQSGAEVVIISFAPPEMLATYREKSALPFPVMSDSTRAAYRVFGLGRTSWGSIFSVGAVGRYLGLILRGWLPRRSRPEEDVLQLGGDFVLDSQRRLIYAHRSTEPTDRPSIESLLDAVGGAVQVAGGRREHQD